MDTQNFLRTLFCGGLAGAAAESLTIPIDVVKVRLQLQGQGGGAQQYRGALHAVRRIAESEGALAFTKGLGPAVLRQLTYGSLRFGLYGQFKNLLGISQNSIDPNLNRKLVAGAGSGGVAAFICTPTDLLKVRMQAQGMKPAEAHLQYRGVTHALTSIVRLDGLAGLYKGVVPTSTRAMIVASAEITSYDEIKCTFRRRGWMQEGLPLHFVSAGLSGLLATLCSSPFDVVKSRLMTQDYDQRGNGVQYKGTLDCFRKSFRAEGPGFGYKGFWPSYLNKGPSVILLFVFYEQISKVWDSALGA